MYVPERSFAEEIVRERHPHCRRKTYVSRREICFAEDTKVGIDPYYGKKHIMIRKLVFNLLSEYGPKSGSFESSDFREENFISEKQQAAREE